MSDALTIAPVRTRGERRRFVDLPFRVFGGDPGWTPPLRRTVMDRLSARYPASAHQETALWLAHRDGTAVGRIGACVDRLFNEFHGAAWGWIGFFEAADDPEAATALFATACDWARERGATEAVGPASFTTNDECGLLVEGHEHPPLFLTPWNPPYYERLWTAAGWEPVRDLWAWRYDRSAGLSERQQRVLARIRDRSGITVRTGRMRDFRAEVGRFYEVYRSAWTRNWGFVPMSEGEVRHLAKNLKQIVDPNFALFAERDGELLGCALVLPDVNETLRERIRDGRLLPLGWLRLLRGVRRCTRMRIIALGVKPEHESRAVGPALYAEIIQRGMATARLTMMEASWILEDNDKMNEAIAAMGAKRYKTWRMYRRELS